MCLKSLKFFYPDYKVNIVTFENLQSYVNFPAHVAQKFNAGKISLTHLSDLLRLELLINYGGIWIDSTVLATGRENDYLHEPLFIFQGTLRNQPAHLGSTWFIVSEKNNPILMATRDLMYKFWEDHDALNMPGFYFVFHCMFKLAAEKYPQLFKAMPVFSNVPPHLLQFEFFAQYNEKRFAQLAAMSNFHKLTWKFPPESMSPENIKGTNAEFILSLL